MSIFSLFSEAPGIIRLQIPLFSSWEMLPTFPKSTCITAIGLNVWPRISSAVWIFVVVWPAKLASDSCLTTIELKGKSNYIIRRGSPFSWSPLLFAWCSLKGEERNTSWIQLGFFLEICQQTSWEGNSPAKQSRRSMVTQRFEVANDDDQGKN